MPADEVRATVKIKLPKLSVVARRVVGLRRKNDRFTAALKKAAAAMFDSTGDCPRGVVDWEKCYMLCRDAGDDASGHARECWWYWFLDDSDTQEDAHVPI